MGRGALSRRAASWARQGVWSIFRQLGLSCDWKSTGRKTDQTPADILPPPNSRARIETRRSGTILPKKFPDWSITATRSTAVPAVNHRPPPAERVTGDRRQSTAAFAVGSGLNEYGDVRPRFFHAEPAALALIAATRSTAVPAVNHRPPPTKRVTIDGRQSTAAFAVGSGLNEYGDVRPRLFHAEPASLAVIADVRSTAVPAVNH
jgi:hypothetical protein